MVFDTDIALDKIYRDSDEHERETWLLKRIRQLEDELKDANNLIKYLQKENEELRQEIEERDYYDELNYERELYDREEGWVD